MLTPAAPRWMPRCVGSPSAGVSAGKTSSFLFTPRCWSTCTTRRLSQLSAPAWKGHQRMGPQACCARGSENPLRALGRRDSGTEQGFRSSGRNTNPVSGAQWQCPEDCILALLPILAEDSLISVSVFPSILDAFTSSKFLSCGFPGRSVVKNPPQYRTHRRHGFSPRVGKIPWRREWQPNPVFLTGESHGPKSLEGYCP